MEKEKLKRKIKIKSKKTRRRNKRNRKCVLKTENIKNMKRNKEGKEQGTRKWKGRAKIKESDRNCSLKQEKWKKLKI